MIKIKPYLIRIFKKKDCHNRTPSKTKNHINISRMVPNVNEKTIKCNAYFQNVMSCFRRGKEPFESFYVTYFRLRKPFSRIRVAFFRITKKGKLKIFFNIYIMFGNFQNGNL